MQVSISEIESVYNKSIKNIYGPYQRSDNREHVIIHYNNDEKETKSYPKLIMEVNLGRKLKLNEVVHHKDEDKLNHAINNLEVKKNKKHAQEHAEKQNEEMVEIQCILCDDEIEKPDRQIRHNKKQNKTGPFCDKSCAGRYGTMVQNNLDDLPKNQYHKYDI